MISTTHITTGAALGLAVGSVIPEPVIAIPVAFLVGVASHHILDMIPHTDAGSFRAEEDEGPLRSAEQKFALFDNIFGTAIVLYIFFSYEPSWAMLFGAAGGNFPDIFHHPHWWSAKTRAMFGGQYYGFHHKYHFTARKGLIALGVLTNLALTIGSLYYILA